MALLSFTKKLQKKSQDSKETRKKKPEVTEEVKKKNSSVGEQKNISSMAQKIMLMTLVTEKSVLLQEHGIVAFRVTSVATKRQIAQAVQEKYGVKVSAINVMNKRGKVRRRGRSVGRTRNWKKAYVHVDDVQAIGTGV